MNRSRPIIFLIVICVMIGENAAQSISSPYSQYGLGEIAEPGLIHNFGMAGVGVATSNVRYINLQNPAQLINNPLSSFTVGIMGDIRNYSTPQADARNFTGALRMMALSFPVVRNRWTTAISVLPYSSVNYDIYSIDSLSNAAAITSHDGSGGLTSLNWSNGVRIYKTLSIGIKSSFVFGAIDEISRSEIFGEEFISNYNIAYHRITSYSDIIFSAGASYVYKINERNHLNFAVMYNLSGQLKGSREETLERMTGLGSEIGRPVDLGTERISFDLPRSYSFGVGYERPNSFQLAVEAELQNWATSQGEQATPERYQDAMQLAVGGEWTPDYQSVNSYFKRVNYRFGVNVKESPYVIRGSQVIDFGINFGASFPVSGYSSLDTGFRFGVRGASDDQFVTENYFQFVIGATINDKWFIKRRYD